MSPERIDCSHLSSSLSSSSPDPPMISSMSFEYLASSSLHLFLPTSSHSLPLAARSPTNASISPTAPVRTPIQTSSPSCAGKSHERVTSMTAMTRNQTGSGISIINRRVPVTRGRSWRTRPQRESAKATKAASRLRTRRKTGCVHVEGEYLQGNLSNVRGVERGLGWRAAEDGSLRDDPQEVLLGDDPPVGVIHRQGHADPLEP